MINNMIVFDIETGGYPEEQIEIPEFEAPSNYKTPEAIQKYIQKKKQEYIEKAAISVFTGEVLAIGYKIYGKNSTDIEILHGKHEKELISEFWDILKDNPEHAVVGWNSNGFDMPFMIRKSWLYSLENIPTYLASWNKPLYKFIDLMQIWGCGFHEFVKLDTVAKYFGIGSKNGDGAKFKEMYLNNVEEALNYLKNDVELTSKVAQKMLYNYIDFTEHKPVIY